MGAKSACSVFARPAGAAPRSTNATWRIQNSRKSALFSWSNHKISPAALCNDRNGHITAENREMFYFGGPGARGPRTCGWEHTFREINLAPPRRSRRPDEPCEPQRQTTRTLRSDPTRSAQPRSTGARGYRTSALRPSDPSRRRVLMSRAHRARSLIMTTLPWRRC